MRSKRIIGIAVATTVILFVPFLAMQFTDEVNWTFGDFVVAGVLLFGAGLAYEWVGRRMENVSYRVAVGVAVAAALALVWVNLAVGLIGSENEPANLMYVGVLAVAGTGVAVARFRPRGMVWAMVATAMALVVLSSIALFLEMNELPGSSVREILAVNGFFIGLFLLSAFLFRRVSDRDSLSSS